MQCKPGFMWYEYNYFKLLYNAVRHSGGYREHSQLLCQTYSVEKAKLKRE